DFTVTGDKADTILSKRDGCGTFSYHFGVMKGHRGMTGPLYFGMSGGVLGDSPVTSTPVPNDGQFHHVAVTFDGNAASDNVRFYIDGQFAGSANGQQTIPATATSPVMGKHAECGYYSSADMDEIAFFQRALSAQEIAALYTAGSEGICHADAPLPPPTGQVAWWRAEGDARDTLGNHHGALQNGISFTSGVAGNGFALDGTNDCVIVPHAEALNIASNGFTVEFWMRGDKTQPGQANNELCLIEKSHGWVTPYAGWAVQVLTDGRVGWGVAAGGTSFPGVRSPVDVLDSQFHHIAGTYDGANITLYVDGQWQGSTNFAGPAVNNTLPVNIGFTWGGGTPKRFFRGTIDEVSIYQRALSAGEIRAILQAGALGKQPPVSVLPPGGQLAWWRAEGNSEDSVGANHGSLNGSAGFTNGMAGQCFRFNGGTDAVMLAPNALNQAFASVTFEAWVYPTQNGHNSGNDYGLTIFSTTDDHGLALRVKDGYLQPDLRLTGGDLKPVFTQRPVPLNQWSHVAFTYDGSQVRGYLNGQLLGSQAASGTVKTSANAGVRTCIGNEPDGAAIQSGGYGWRGWIDEPALYGRALRGEELAAIYASGSAGKRPPEYLTPPDGLVAWWRAENDGRDTAGGHHAVPQNGLSFTNGFVGQAFTLNAAATMHLRVTNRPALNPTNITLAAWVKPFSYPTVGCAILRKEAGATDQYLLQLGDGTTAGVPHFNSGIPGGWSTGTTPLPLNHWSHIVGTYNGRTACVYLNGLLVDSRTVTGPMPVTTHDLFIGRMEGDTQRNFDGLIDEAAIWNRGLSSD
ncbi:MAG TPA: LamG domain-containing protein, partial [Verrucomicrobiae bacterium]